jgi:hypothetical protein
MASARPATPIMVEISQTFALEDLGFEIGDREPEVGLRHMLLTFESHAIGCTSASEKATMRKMRGFPGLRAALGRAIVVPVSFSLFDIVETQSWASRHNRGPETKLPGPHAVAMRPTQIGIRRSGLPDVEGDPAFRLHRSLIHQALVSPSAAPRRGQHRRRIRLNRLTRFRPST